MKKLSFLLIGMAAISLSSCVNKDDYDYDPTYENAQRLAQYKQNFEKEFGEIPSDQSFDFYATQYNNTKKSLKTRAASDVVVDNTIGQPSTLNYDGWKSLLSGKDNHAVGSHEYTLTSPGNGKFKVYAVQYAGWYPTYKKFNFEMGLIVGDDTANPIKIFDGRNVDTEPVSDGTGAAFTANPGFGADIYVPSGESFYFYIKYTNNGVTNTIYSKNNSTLLYSDLVAANKKIMVIGFEDSLPNSTDYNDIILYVEGNPDLPLPEAKRFMCEDLGNTGDFDFNDIVFDIQPAAENGKAIVTLQAAGGTLESELWVAGQDLGEVHKLLGINSYSTMINTGAGATANQYSTTITVPNNFDLASFRDFKVVITEDDHTREVTYSGDGQVPCVIMTPIETAWVKETVNVKKAYPKFFADPEWTKTYDKEQLYEK